jgi:hypothetical protein
MTGAAMWWFEINGLHSLSPGIVALDWGPPSPPDEVFPVPGVEDGNASFESLPAPSLPRMQDKRVRPKKGIKIL